MTRLAKLAKEGEVGQMVEAFVRRTKWDNEDAAWQVLSELSDKLLTLDGRSNGTAITEARDISIRDFRKFAAATHPQVVTVRGGRLDSYQFFAARGEDLTVTPKLACGFFASSGPLTAHQLCASVIFAGGSVQVDQIVQSVVVCDGDFTARQGAANCLILARGNISSGQGMGGCHVVASGRIHCKESLPHEILKEKDRLPLGFIKFFDAADVGIVVEWADGGARVKSAEKGKPFAAAGVRADDLITAVNGKDVKDAESFRRLLRASLAVDGETVLKVRRDNKVSEVRVPAPK